MPRFMSSEQYLAGYISAKMDVLQVSLNRLASHATFTRTELENMREIINMNDASIRSQHRSIFDMRLRPSLTIYENVLELTLTELARREENRGRPVPESDAMRARRLRSSDLDAYASDGRGEVPLERWSVINPSLSYHPESAADLRRVLENRRQGREAPEYPNACSQEACSSAQSMMQRTSEDWHDELRQRAMAKMEMEQDEDERPNRELSPMSVRSCSSVSSFASYVSSKQTEFSSPVSGVSYPPMEDELSTPIDPDDPDLIGRSEFYTRRATADTSCPDCGGAHPMIRCPNVLGKPMRERWYRALRAGVCLNCLRVGHSSFTCRTEGACRRCKTRHNSVLCPTLAKNKATFNQVKRIARGQQRK